MQFPRRFAYGPRLRPLAICFLIGCGLLTLVKIHFWPAAALGALLLLFATAAAARRIFVPRFIELETDGALIPLGRQRVKVPFAAIEATHERVFGAQSRLVGPMTTLRLKTKDRLFEINSRLLPDHASYVQIRDYITARVAPSPKPTLPERGFYAVQCAYEGNGTISNSLGEILWRFKTLHNGRPHYPYGIFHLPDFIIQDLAEKEVCRVKLARHFSLGTFTMLENGTPICTIKQRSFLRNKFTLDFADGQKWVFKMPLFSVRFGGTSKTGAKIRALVRTHNLWHVLIDPAADNPQLVAALAFIHRERLRFN